MPPVARLFNINFRATDAATCSHLALAAMVNSAWQGIEESLTAPAETQEELLLSSPAELDSRGATRLPETREAALDALSPVV